MIEQSLIFKESETYRPFCFPFAVEAEKQQRIETYWHEGQIDLQDDLRQYLSKDGLKTKDCSHESNKKLLDTLLLFFTQLDMNVASGYVEILPYAKNNEIKSLFIQQAAKEVVHQRAYALAGETFGFTDADWAAFRQYKQMTDKLSVISKQIGYLFEPINFAKKLAVILLSEGIGLFAAFTSLLNFKRTGLLIGFNDVNQWSLLDEHCHVQNNIKVLQECISKLSPSQATELQQWITDLVKEFVQVEHDLIDLLGNQQDIDKQDFKDYITYLGNLRLFEIGYIGKLEVGINPLKWMDSMLSSDRSGSFFEKKITDYTHKKLEGKVDYSKYYSLLNIN